MPTVTGMSAWRTGRKRETNTAIPPRRSTNAAARSQLASPRRRPSQERRIAGPAQRPIAKPTDWPARVPTITAAHSATKCTGSRTPVAAATTIVSPGTTSPTNSVVSRKIAREAMSVPQIGPIATTASSTQTMKPESHAPKASNGFTRPF